MNKTPASFLRPHLARCIALAWMTAAAPSAAQPAPGTAGTPASVAQAQALFDEAMALIKDGKYAEACPKLKKSQDLDPGMATKYRLAECYESAGLTGSAWALFLEVAADAKAAGRPDRESKARSRADALRPKVPMMTLAVPVELASLPGLRIERDGEVMPSAKWNVPLPVDPGAHMVRASAPGKKPWERSTQALGGATLQIDVPLLEADDRPPEPPPAGTGTAAPTGIPSVSSSAPPAGSTAPPPGGALDGYRVGAIVAGAVGLVGIGVGAGFGAATFAKWGEALSHCPDGPTQPCAAPASALEQEARTSGTISTAAFVAGGVGLATGALLLILAPKGAPAKEKSGVTVTPVIGQHGMMTLFQGRF